MDLWGSFKKKVEDVWENRDQWDFWDVEENKQQLAARTQAKLNARNNLVVNDNPTPNQTITVAKPQNNQTITVAKPKALPEITIPDAPEKKNYVGFTLDNPQNKEIFGLDVGGLSKALGGTEKKYTLNTGKVVQDSEKNVLDFYDKVRREFRNKWVNDLKEMAQDKTDDKGVVTKGNADAQRTLDLLKNNGRLKGDFVDFVDSASDSFLGNMGRENARLVDFVVPGDQGLTRWADSDEKNRKSATDAGDAGVVTGLVPKVAADIATLVAPGAVGDKFMKGTKFIQGMNATTKAQKAGKFVVTQLPGSAASSGVDYLQQVGRGEDANLGRSLAVGAAADLSIPVILKPLAKLVGAGKNQIGKLLGKGGELADDTPVMVKKSDDLGPLKNKQLEKADMANIKYGSDTLGSDLDPATVQKYVNDIKAGEAIDPLVVTRENGQLYLQDGKHRMAALEQLGKGEVPIVVRDTPLPAKATIKEGKPQQVAELLGMDRFSRKTTESVDQLLSKQYGVSEQTVRRLRNGYGDDTARNILARSSDATNIRDMDAFVISEARKNYGSPTVKIERKPRPSEVGADEISAATKATPDSQMKEIVDSLSQTPTPAPKSKLGSIVEDFYDKTKGKDVRIGYRALNDLGQKVSRQVDDDLAEIGSDFSDVARRIQEGSRNGARTLDEAGLTPNEAEIIRKAQDEMNYIRRRASVGTKEVGKGDFGEVYLPQQTKGQYDGDSLYKGFRDTKPGSELARKNKIELEDLDYSPDVIGQYIVRYGDTKAYREQRIYNTFLRNNPDTEEHLIQEASDSMIRLQDKVNNLKTKISLGGFGMRTTKAGKEVVDTAGELSKIGKSLNKQQVPVTGQAKGLTNGDKINSVLVGDKPLGDYVGLNQYRDAQSYASKQMLDAGGDMAELARMVEQRLIRDYSLTDDAVEYAVGGISRMAADLPQEVVLAKLTGTYRSAAKQQLMDQLQTVDIKDPGLRKTVNSLTNQILREGTIEQALSAKVVRGALSTTNAIFRKLNVSSAMNELGDMTSFLSAYGKDTRLVPDFKAIKEFGLGEIDAAIEPYIKQIQRGNSVKSVLKKINSGTNLYKFVEAYKAGVVASSAKKFYTAKGLEGDELVQAVLKDYRDIALPVDAFTKTALDNFPLYTQYMTWGVRNLQKEGRLATGKLGTGKLGDMSRMERVFRNAYANLPAKTAWWLTSNGLKGTGILTAFGLTDFTGMTNQDFSGIREEDKSFYDKTTQFTNSSTMLSILNTIVQSVEKEQLKEKYADANYNPYEDNRADEDIIRLFTPQFIKNLSGAGELMDKGYSENKAGRVQYEAPTDAWNTFKAYVFGKNQTANAREYSGRENLVDRVSEGENPFVAIKDMAAEQLGLQDQDYNRPLTDEYSEAYKKAEDDAKAAWLEGGRKYNEYLDDLRKNTPDLYNTYIGAMKDHVNPEYWSAITDGGNDLTTFKMMAERKKQYAKDFKTSYDPIYDLPDNQAKAVLQQKSTATGDDIALRNALYKEQWYQDYMDRVREYYDNRTETVDSDYKQTERVMQWYDLNDQYNGMKTLTTDTGERPAWSQEYPAVFASKTIINEYGFDSDQSKAFFKTYGDQYRAEKELYDAAQLELINQMREIEGYPPMSAAAYAQVTAIEDTDSDSSGGYGDYKKTATPGSKGDFGQTRGLTLPSISKTKRSSVKINRSKTPKTVAIKRNKNYK